MTDLQQLQRDWNGLAKKDAMWQKLEAIGNIRVETMSFCVSHGKDRATPEFVYRVTGKANVAWILKLGDKTLVELPPKL